MLLRCQTCVAHYVYGYRALDNDKVVMLLLLDSLPLLTLWRLKANLPEDQNPWTMQKIENLDSWPERHLYRVISSHDINIF